MSFFERLSVMAAVVSLSLGLILSSGANALATQVTAIVSLQDQEMKVTVNGWRRYSWKVSTARRGYRTPTGTFRPTRMYKRYYSKKYHHSPMPWSVFFYHGYAIHGTTAIRHLGRPASHGCIRLHPDNARKLFDLVKEYGAENTTIVVTR